MVVLVVAVVPLLVQEHQDKAMQVKQLEQIMEEAVEVLVKLGEQMVHFTVVMESLALLY